MLNHMESYRIMSSWRSVFFHREDKSNQIMICIFCLHNLITIRYKHFRTTQELIQFSNDLKQLPLSSPLLSARHHPPKLILLLIPTLAWYLFHCSWVISEEVWNNNCFLSQELSHLLTLLLNNNDNNDNNMERINFEEDPPDYILYF